MPSGRQADQALAARGLIRHGSAPGPGTGVAQNAGAVSMTAASLQSELGQALREASEVTVCGVASREFITAIQAVASSVQGTPTELPWDLFRYVTPAPTLILANRWNVRLGPVVQQWQSAVTALRNSVQQWTRPEPETADKGFHLLSMDLLYLQMSVLVKQRETGRQRVWAAIGPPTGTGVEQYVSYEEGVPEFQQIAASITEWAAGASDFLTRQVDCNPVDPAAATVGNDLLASGAAATDERLWQLPIRALEPYGATARRRTCLPVTICVVRSLAGGHPVVLLKRRSHMTANDDFGKLSLLSARVLEEDVAVALGVVPFLDRDSAAAIDAMWLETNFRSPGLTLSREAFIHAGQRELFYSTGLDIPENRFRLCGFQVMERENTDEQLFFCVFEVVLYRRDPDELGLANQWGDPRVLTRVGESVLYSGTYDGELNRLLVRGREWLQSHVFNEPVPVVPDGP
ncbi:hypothetical protein [Streptomyces sp. NPDC086787]|uniref:hypothetical protein n=1 Tax=Streptomyces sp. NPDC086787 TaxID=3365759 RepID=UPI003810C361